MADNNGFVIKVEKLRAHPNADRLQLLEVFGSDVCVGLDVRLGDIGVYFPTNLQLSLEFCLQNTLLRKLPDGTKSTGYLEPDKRNITAIKLRGVKSDGLYVPLSAFAYTGVDLSTLTPGTIITNVNGHEICAKYIPCTKNTQSGDRVSKTRHTHRKVPVAPLFQEHADTEQLVYHLDDFKPGDQIELTLKVHGTSQRTAYLPKLVEWKHHNPIFNFILKKDPDKLGKIARKWYYQALETATPIYDWGYVSGTRRTILNDWEGGFYGSDLFRKQHADFFEGKLQKGEAVYYEVAGFTDTGMPIMGSCSNKGLNDKEFMREYGETTCFSYGCEPTGKKIQYGMDADGQYSIEIDVPQSRIFVYRMTITTADGYTVEYTPDFMRYRCAQMGVECVPVFWKGYIPEQMNHVYDLDTGEDYIETAGQWVQDLVEEYYDGPDPIGKTHVREGVVVRIVNRPSFTAYKHKNWYFKALTGIISTAAADSDTNLSEDILSEL